MAGDAAAVSGFLHPAVESATAARKMLGSNRRFKRSTSLAIAECRAEFVRQLVPSGAREPGGFKKYREAREWDGFQGFVYKKTRACRWLLSIVPEA
jgi:hypothetical protein